MTAPKIGDTEKWDGPTGDRYPAVSREEFEKACATVAQYLILQRDSIASTTAVPGEIAARGAYEKAIGAHVELQRQAARGYRLNNGQHERTKVWFDRVDKEGVWWGRVVPLRGDPKYLDPVIIPHGACGPGERLIKKRLEDGTGLHRIFILNRDGQTLTNPPFLRLD